VNPPETNKIKKERETMKAEKLSSRFETMRNKVSSALLLLAGVCAMPMQAETVTRTFEFGPGTLNHHSNMRTLSVPARTKVFVSGEVTLGPLSLNVLTTMAVPVTIDVHAPNGTTSGTAGADGPLIGSMNVMAVPLAAPNTEVPFAFVAMFESDFGCPSTWRVRVRTSDNTASKARVSGTIILTFFEPGVVNLDMSGDPLTLEGGSRVTRKLAGRALIGSDDALIERTDGQFRIKADWDTSWDPLVTSTLNAYHPLRVKLLRPDGTVADEEKGFPQHTPADKLPSGAVRLHFVYTLTAADALMVGDWKLEIINSNEAKDIFGATKPIKIHNFDIEKFLSFSSTFTPECN